MRFQLLALLPLALANVLPRGEEVNYDGFEAFRIETDGNPEEVKSMLSSMKYSQWNHQNKKHLDICVAPEDVEEFKKKGLRWKQMHKDLGKAIKEEKKWKKYPGKKGKLQCELPDESYFDSYHPYEDHIQFWDDLHTAFPYHSEKISSGTSLEGRDLFGLKLFGCPGKNKKAVIWHGTVHAREWITTMTLEYIAYQMIDGYKNNRKMARSLLDEYDFYIIPIVNPDGFVYSQEVDRLWRKNRTPAPDGFFNQTCIGVDVNRNWPYKWKSNPDGSSPDPCDATYRGESPGSTPENQGMVAFINQVANKQDIKFYVDWHSYGQYILTPYGYSCSAVAENSEEQVDLAGETAAVIESVHGTDFTFGPICDTLYATNGGSTDYVYDVAGAEYSWAFELRDEGRFGFVLPPRQIRPVGEEMWQGVKYAIANM